MKEKAVLPNLPELMLRLTHNVSKLNSRIVTTKYNLNCNGLSALDLLCQFFPDYLIFPDR